MLIEQSVKYPQVDCNGQFDNFQQLQLYYMRRAFYNFQSWIHTEYLGPVYKRVGRSMYVWGTQFQGQFAGEDRLVPSLRKTTHQGKTPLLQTASFVAPNAVVLGDVELGEKSSIWYGATVLGTLPIRVGSHTVLQDRVHVSRQVSIGNHVFVGPNAILQGSTLDNRSFVGMGATVRHATVQRQAVVAAGAVVADNVTVPSGQIWAGCPAVYVRDVSPIEKQILREHLEEAHELAMVHEEETSKSFREILTETSRLPEPNSFDQITSSYDLSELPLDEDDEQYIEQRIFMKQKVQPNDSSKRDYDPYEHEISNFPDHFTVGMNQDQFEKVRLNMNRKVNQDRTPWTTAF